MGRLIDVDDIDLKKLQVAARDDDGDAYVSVRDVVRMIQQTPSADLEKIKVKQTDVAKNATAIK